MLNFNLATDKGKFACEIKVPAGPADKLLGTASLRGNVLALRLERTTLKSFAAEEVNREIMQRPVGDPQIVEAGLLLLEDAAKNKAKPEEVRAWAEKAVKTAEMHGPRWHRQVMLAVVNTLSEQEPFANIAATTYARQAERLLDPKDKPAVQQNVLESLALALEKAGKADDAKEIRERMKKIDFTLKPAPFAGRQGTSDRAVLVELFTGAQCPPCVAADMAFDGLAKAFKPSEVILLQYHLHVPGPDPLTNPDTISRSRFYAQVVRGTPTILFNGAPAVPASGRMDAAEEKFDAFAEVVEQLLEAPSGAKIKLAATKKENKIDIAAEVADLANPGVQTRLRLVLVEEAVNYTGANSLEVHHHVVRAFPGGTDGLVLKEKTGKTSVTVDLSNT